MRIRTYTNTNSEFLLVRENEKTYNYVNKSAVTAILSNYDPQSVLIAGLDVPPKQKRKLARHKDKPNK